MLHSTEKQLNRSVKIEKYHKLHTVRRSIIVAAPKYMQFVE